METGDWGLGIGASGTVGRLSAYRCLSSRRTPSFGVGQLTIEKPFYGQDKGQLHLTGRSYAGPTHSEEFRYLPIVTCLPVNTKSAGSRYPADLGIAGQQIDHPLSACRQPWAVAFILAPKAPYLASAAILYNSQGGARNPSGRRQPIPDRTFGAQGQRPGGPINPRPQSGRQPSGIPFPTVRTLKYLIHLHQPCPEGNVP